MTSSGDSSVTPSKSEINKCGELIRKVRYEGLPMDLVDIDHAIATISWFRAQHAYPMAKVRYGLTSMVRTEGADEVISQRLKRVPRIVRKLHRTVGTATGRTALARLEDIGGVRAILKDGPELDRVRRRIERNWKTDFKRPPRDYITQPKAIGYRAIHFVVVRDGRAIEVQLRTRGQQEWADAAESADARLGHRGVNLKDSEGPEEMLEYFSAAGEVIHHREYGIPMSYELTKRFNLARRSVIETGYYNA